MHARFSWALIVGLAVGASACTRPSNNEINVSDEGMANGVAASRYLTPVALEKLEIGRSINSDRTIKDEADSFKPNEKIYASIAISGSANSGIVRALWTDGRGQKVRDDTRIVTPSNRDVLAIEADPPQGQGWAGGTYKLDVYLDNKLADSARFSVEGGPPEEPNPPRGLPRTNPAGH